MGFGDEISAAREIQHTLIVIFEKAWFRLKLFVECTILVCTIFHYFFMEKSLRIVTLRNKQNDFLYWSSTPELERLTTIELLRMQ